MSNQSGKLGFVYQGKYYTFQQFQSLALPEQFRIPYNIQKTSSGYKVDVDITSKKPATDNTYYVDLDNGNNANSGADWDNALETPNAARAKSGSKTIYIAGGTRVFNRSEMMVGDLAGDAVIIGVDRGNGYPVISSRFENLSWVADGLAWKTTRSAMGDGDVRDATNLDGDSLWGRLEKQSDFATVKGFTSQQVADKGGVWAVVGNEVMVRTFDDRDLSADDDDLHLLYASNGLQNGTGSATAIGPRTTYMENITFAGGKWCFQQLNGDSTDKPCVYAKNCKFHYALTGSCVDLNGVHDFIFEDCEAMGAYLDGFNYHSRLGHINGGLEINCKGKQNGTAGTNYNNGSTIHGGGWICRVGGEYADNNGNNTHDINNSTYSLNIGVTYGESTGGTATTHNGAAIGDGAEAFPAYGWFMDCDFQGTSNDADLYVHTDCFAYCQPLPDDTAGAGTVTEVSNLSAVAVPAAV